MWAILNLHAKVFNVFKPILTVLMCFLLSVLAGCSTLMPRLLPFDDLPAPSGAAPVGTQIMDLTDSARDEWFTLDADDKRRIMVQLWYPAANVSGAPYPYIDHPQQRLTPLAKQMGLPAFLIQHIGDVSTNAVLAASPAVSSSKAPVIIFSHGLGGTKNQNTVQAEELASLGYIVVAVDHAYDAYLTIFDDGSLADYRSKAEDGLTVEEFWAVRTPQLATRTADIHFLLEVMTARQARGESPWANMDLTRIGIFGHSYGGATSIMAASTDSRIKATIALDGWMLPIPDDTIDAGLDTPFLYIGRSSWEDPINYQKLDSLLDHSQGNATRILWEGTKHMDFSDAPQLSSASSTLGLSGKLSRDELRQRLNHEIVTFFNIHVRDRSNDQRKNNP
ncbi:MAG: dienelactone hydrolase [Saprospiraceae bacterium]|jgi:dienelactone hydrolase